MAKGSGSEAALHRYRAVAEGTVGHDPASHVLRGRRLIIARTLWVALVAPASVLCVVALYARYLMLSAPPDAVRESLAQLGLSTGFFAVYYEVLGTIFGIGCFAVAAVIARRKPNDGMALTLDNITNARSPNKSLDRAGQVAKRSAHASRFEPTPSAVTTRSSRRTSSASSRWSPTDRSSA